MRDVRDAMDGRERDEADGDCWIGRIEGESERARACVLVLPESAYVFSRCVCVVIIHLQ